MAATTNEGNRRIDLQSDPQNDDGQASATLNFQVSAGPVSVGSGIPTGGDGTNSAFYGKPKYPSSADQFYQTESVGQWTAPCTYSRTCGSPNMQANTHPGAFRVLPRHERCQLPDRCAVELLLRWPCWAGLRLTCWHPSYRETEERRGGRHVRPPRSPRMTRRVFWLGLTAALVGCTPSVPERASDIDVPSAMPSAVTNSAAVACPGEDLPPLLVAAGEDPLDARLYRYGLCTRELHRIGERARFSSVSAADDHVVVTNAEGGPDRVALLADEQLAPLGDVGTPGGYLPVVDAAGRVAFSQLNNDEERPFTVQLWQPNREGELKTLADSDVPTFPIGFGPDGRLAVVENIDDIAPSTRRPVITIHNVDTGETSRPQGLPISVVHSLAWSEDARVIAVTGDDEEEGLILDGGTSEVVGRIPPGYRALAIAPGGQELLLKSKDLHLGLLALSPLEQNRIVRPLPDFPSGEVVHADWP